MDLQEIVFDKEAFREELRTQKLKVAKLEEQNLETSKIRQELKDSRIMVHVKDVETQKFGTQLQKYKGRHERLRVNRDDLAKELEKDKHDRKKPLRHEQDLKSLTTLKIYWPLEDQTPVIYLC